MKKSFQKIYCAIKQIPLETFMWIGALVYLVFIDPYKIQHYSLCLFNNLGIDFCPGCGIGRSIAMIYHGDILQSLQMHPLGLFALIIICLRIYKLLKIETVHSN